VAVEVEVELVAILVEVMVPEATAIEGAGEGKVEEVDLWVED